MWVDYQEGDVQGKEFIFDIPIYAGNLAIASSTGIDPQNPEAGFNQTMYDGFDITVASEVMAIFCLSNDLQD